MARAVSKSMLETLAALPIFADCTKRELESLVNIGTTIRVDPGYVFTRQGRRGFEFFVLLAGEAECLVDGSQVARFGPGDFFGEMSLLNHAPRTATVKAVTEAEVLVIDSREFEGMLIVAPGTIRPILNVLSQRLRAAEA